MDVLFLLVGMKQSPSMKSSLFMGKSIKNPVKSTATAISYITKNIKFSYKAGIKEISAPKKENSCICCTEQMQSAKENEGLFFSCK